MKALQTLGLTKRYGSRIACDHINLSVDQGEIFGLLGPNGAGKSTLVKMLVGLVHPSAGSARVLGFSFREMAPRRHLGYLPELFRYPPWLKAGEVLSFHARLLGIDLSDAEREALLERVGLGGRTGDRVRTFSKGMQQRLGLAVALVGRPWLVFLDEPTSALDPIGRYEVGQLLLDLKKSGTTVFLNSHLLSDVEKVCDSVALIDHGQVIYHGSLRDAIAGEAQRYRIVVDQLSEETAEMMAAAFPDAMIQWGGKDGVEIHLARRRELVPDVINALVSCGVRVYEVELHQSSLEEWFLNRLRKDTR
jgi:ABC-2 type transport system ATP-binding protein